MASTCTFTVIGLVCLLANVFGVEETKADEAQSKLSATMSKINSPDDYAVFKEGPLGGEVTNLASNSKLSLESANKDSNAKSEVLGEVLSHSCSLSVRPYYLARNASSRRSCARSAPVISQPALCLQLIVCAIQFFI